MHATTNDGETMIFRTSAPKTKPRLDQFRVWRTGTNRVLHLTLNCMAVDRWLTEPGNHPSQLSCVERAAMMAQGMTICSYCAEQTQSVRQAS